MPGALGRESAPCSQASHNGLWMNPVKGLGALERWRWGLSGLRSLWGVGRGWSGHQTCMRRQINTRATRRSWYNNRGGAMMMSPFTVMKGDNCTEFTHF